MHLRVPKTSVGFPRCAARPDNTTLAARPENTTLASRVIDSAGVALLAVLDPLFIILDHLFIPILSVLSVPWVICIRGPIRPFRCAPNHPALHCTALHCTALHCTALRYGALHCVTVHCTALHCAALQCSALRCAALHCTALRCTTPLSTAALTSSDSASILCIAAVAAVLGLTGRRRTARWRARSLKDPFSRSPRARARSRSRSVARVFALERTRDRARRSRPRNRRRRGDRAVPRSGTYPACGRAGFRCFLFVCVRAGLRTN
jgi:hypothetical protein